MFHNITILLYFGLNKCSLDEQKRLFMNKKSCIEEIKCKHHGNVSIL